MATRRDFDEREHDRRKASPTPPAETAQETIGARLLRTLHASWRALALRGTTDTTFQGSLSGLRDAVGACWQAGLPATLTGHGSGLLVAQEKLSPYTSGNLLAHMVADEWQAMELNGISFLGPWDDAEVARFLQLLEDWRRSKTPPDARGEELEAMGIQNIILVEPQEKEDEEAQSSGWDAVAELGELRRQARDTFFHALRCSRWSMQSMTGDSLPQLRRTRQVVHQIIDTLIGEEFSLLALTALKAFDVQTFLHSVNVCILATALGQRVGLNRRELSELGMAALLHDLGKMAVPKPVLNKPGTFSPAEWEIMRMHPLEGVRTLLRCNRLADTTIKIMLVGLEHHMRCDLSGYPRLDDEWEIGVLSRIVSIADCYDAMTSRRSYEEESLIPHRVMLHMLGRGGRNFDPVLMRLFVNLMGLYPVGSLVELSSGEWAVVVAANRQDVLAPIVRLVRQIDGTSVDPTDLRLLNLAEPKDEAAPAPTIRKALNPQSEGVALVDYLL